MNYYKFNPTIEKLLKQYGDKQIEMITIYKKPIKSYIKTILNTLSLGQLDKNLKEAKYDKLFHLYMVFKISDYENIFIEKNERINIKEINTKFDYHIPQRVINNINNLTINQMLNNTINMIGKDNFFIYKSHSWNCQNFIMNVLKSNNLLNQELSDFILQDTKKIFYNMGYIKPISDIITDTAASINIIKEGGTIKNKKDYIVQSIIFENMNEKDCLNFCIEHKYKFNKVDIKENKIIIIRQYTPNYLKKKGYSKYIKSHTYGNNEKISLIIAYKILVN